MIEVKVKAVVIELQSHRKCLQIGDVTEERMVVRKMHPQKIPGTKPQRPE